VLRFADMARGRSAIEALWKLFRDIWNGMPAPK
jgi:hypothetical protein